MMTKKGLLKLLRYPQKIFIDYKLKKSKKNLFFYQSKSLKELKDTLYLLAKEIRVYHFEEVSNSVDYIGIDSLQLPLFLSFYKNYITDKSFSLELQGKKYSVNNLDTLLILTLLAKSKNIYLHIIDGNEIASIEILIADIKDDFLLFRASNIPYKRQRYINKQPFGDIKLKELNNQYFDSIYNFTKPIDVVYTWVNSQDKDWQKLFSQFKNLDEVDKDRFDSIDELKYSLRSIEQYAPWVNKIYILTNCAKPNWLDNHPLIEWIDHKDVFKQEELPTFNSHSLGLSLVNIPNLLEHFIYLNDDFFLFNRVKKEDFFTSNDLSISYLEPYGIVYHDRINYDKEFYALASMNGKKLFEEKYKISPTQLHRHVPYSFKRSVLLEMEKVFKKEIEHTRKNHFRDASDVSVSFLYNHYALYKKEAVYQATNSILVNFRNYKMQEKNILKRRPKFVCINDGAGSSEVKEYKEWTAKFLEKSFPKMAVWEK